MSASASPSSAAGGSGAGAGGSGAPPVALGGLGGSLEDKDCELLCPVCFELIEEAYVTRCGHSFCFACISKAVELQRRCPKCGAALPSREHVFPNFLLNEVVAKKRAAGAASAGASGDSGVALRELVAARARALPLHDVDALLGLLARRQRRLRAESAHAHQRLLHEFLSQLLAAREAQLRHVEREVQLVRRDLARVAGALRAAPPDEPEPPPAPDEPFARAAPPDELAARWRRLSAHLDDFVQCYFAHRADELYFPPESEPGAAAAVAGPEPAAAAPESGAGSEAGAPEPAERRPESPELGGTRPAAPPEPRGLDAFREDLVAFTRYRALRPLATLSYCSDAINYSTIVSTIEFDKDEEMFAIAGVTKRIKVFEWEAVVRDAVDVHYPAGEMQCSHKVSCVSWNAYHKQVLASADYEGTVCVWDAGTGQRTRALAEHDKRAWSVHFNRCDVRLLASGSDDARVKLWSLTCERSVATLEAKFNVCCVRFNPRSSVHLAFGSADHCVHYYDLRAPRVPLCVLRDHRKAVSYVQFVDSRTLVSASTDSQLKLWRVDSPRCLRSFTGHTNEKNFVGLATDGRYVACGSENNALYVYYRGLARPLLHYRFDAAPLAEPAEFVSAVCWRRAEQLLAANSQGTIKVLELV